MPTLKFRFNTECQMTIDGQSYEEAYLRFKDFMDGDRPVAGDEGLEAFPPEDATIYFEVDDQTDYNTIDRFKGDFVDDIVSNVADDLQARLAHPKRIR